MGCVRGARARMKRTGRRGERGSAGAAGWQVHEPGRTRVNGSERARDAVRRAATRRGARNAPAATGQGLAPDISSSGRRMARWGRGTGWGTGGARHGGRCGGRGNAGRWESMLEDAGGCGELRPWRGCPARVRLAVAIGRGVFRNGEADGLPGNPSAHRRNVRGTPRRPPPWLPVRIRCARGCGCFPAARIPGPGRAPQAAGRAVRKR